MDTKILNTSIQQSLENEIPENTVQNGLKSEISEKKGNVNEQEMINLLSPEVPETKIQNDLELEISGKRRNKDRGLIKNVNNQVLIDFLSPEISKNELAKRCHKYILIALMTAFLIVQFRSVHNISIKVIDYAITGQANKEIVKQLLTFVSAYITSVVVELIAILKYIVKNVFDTSLAELVKIFKDTDILKKEQEKS